MSWAVTDPMPGLYPKQRLCTLKSTNDPKFACQDRNKIRGRVTMLSFVFQLERKRAEVLTSELREPLNATPSPITQRLRELVGCIDPVL